MITMTWKKGWSSNVCNPSQPTPCPTVRLQPFLVQSMILTVIIAVKCGQDDVQSHYKIVWLLCLFQRLLVGRQVLALASQLSTAYELTTCLDSRFNVPFVVMQHRQQTCTAGRNYKLGLRCEFEWKLRLKMRKMTISKQTRILHKRVTLYIANKTDYALI